MCPKESGGICRNRFELFEKKISQKNIEERHHFCQAEFFESERLINESDHYELNWGLTNFDNIVSAFLTIFQCITMEGWTKIMNIYQDVYMEQFVLSYFVMCVVICSFFLLNLTIAVMLMKYEELDKNTANSKHDLELRQIGVSVDMPLALINFLIK